MLSIYVFLYKIRRSIFLIGLPPTLNGAPAVLPARRPSPSPVQTRARAPSPSAVTRAAVAGRGGAPLLSQSIDINSLFARVKQCGDYLGWPALADTPGLNNNKTVLCLPNFFNFMYS